MNGKKWGKLNDTVGVGGAFNSIYGVHQAYFNLGGLGILIGDGSCRIPHSRKSLRPMNRPSAPGKN